MSNIELCAAAAPEEDHGYWWLNANPRIWSFSDIAVGEVQSYTLYNENGNKRRIFQNFLDAKVGDMIIGYESNPVKQIVAIGRISAEQDGEKLFFEKIEGLTSPIDYTTLKECPELERMEYFQNPQGSLFKLTRGEYDFILDMIREENPITAEASIDVYTKSNFLDEVYMSEKRYENLVAVLHNKKNIILQGAPGVGKTFAARRLAWSMMEEKDDSRIEFVQFHQNYSYEDFVMGYKPVEDSFELKYGIFYRFCQKAANQPDKEFFFIIDEINRGNMSKIFGELLMLIERDYRGIKATLAYNGLPFSVPKNLYIIGMMNTADRSLAMIDYALRRRFSFFEIEPGFDSEGFIHYQNGLNNETLNELVSKVKELNREIAADKSLGKGFCIGHSYFCGKDVCTDEWLHSIVDYDILPMLSEYWFDSMTKSQSIFIKNIYYMLSYAFTTLNQGGYEDIATEEFENIHNLFAAILAKGIGRQLKQGLYREYLNQKETVTAVRGKIDIPGTIQNRLARRQVLTCEYDELSENNLLNQILKTTVMLLLCHARVDQAYKSDLKKEMLFFSNVDTIDPTAIRWSAIRFQRNNNTYRMLISLCQLILEGMLLTSDSGDYRLASFIDEQRMNRLYEKFILEYYAKECPQVTATASQIQWALDDGISTMLPVMQSDIMLTRGNEVLIIDAKYYTHTTQTQYDVHTLHSGNLYQIFTYVKNKEAEFGNEPHQVSGMLLYAATDEAIQPDNRYRMSGNQISVKTLDLNRNFSEISAQLNRIVEDHFL